MKMQRKRNTVPCTCGPESRLGKEVERNVRKNTMETKNL
jgi:hypothetical protein